MPIHRLMSEEALLQELGQRIGRLRLERNLTQAQLAPPRSGKMPAAKPSCWRPSPPASTAPCSMGPSRPAAWCSNPPKSGAAAALA